jgi:uncharacterized membrane protein
MFGIKKRIQAYFFTGLLIVFPLAISLIVLSFLFVKLSDVVFPILPLPEDYRNIPETRMFFRTISVLLLFSLITFIGFIATNVLGKKLLRFGENLIIKIPFFSKIYVAVKQISQAFLGGKKVVFKEVVAFEYPRKGIFSIGFASGEASKTLFSKLPVKTFVNIFVPTVPNPTSGFFILVPKEEIIHLDLSIEDGFKLIISGGVVLPNQIDTNDTESPN